MSALFQSAHGINSSEAGFIPGAHDFWPDVLLLPLTHAPQDVQPCALLLLANLDINLDLYAGAIRKRQAHPYLYGVGGLGERASK